MGSHTGENQAAIVWDVIKEYNLQKRVGYFILDNTSSNDTALQALDWCLTESGILQLQVYFILESI